MPSKKAKAQKNGWWSLTKKIFLGILILHVGWFVIFMSQMSVEDFASESLKKTSLFLTAFLLGIVAFYFFWWRKFEIVKRVASTINNIFFIVYISCVLYLLLGRVFNPPITLTQLGSLLSGNGLSRDNISFDQMGPNIKLAVIASEDQLFPDHDGFDLKAIKRAIKYNKKHPNKVRGASTLSQQVAKNVFLWQGRTNFRKALEAFFTFSIEKCWSKEIILERYLNVAEMGKGIFGVQAAAKKYFNKDAKDLSRAEAAMIAASLPNPKKFTVVPLSGLVAGRYGNIMRQMNNLEGDPDIQELIGAASSAKK